MAWEMARQLGYEPKTTFWQDFSIAETFSKDSVKDTASRAFNEWKDDVIFLTELIMVLNHKCWYWYHKGNNELSGFYGDLYYNYNDKALDYLESKHDDEAIRYFLRTLD